MTSTTTTNEFAVSYRGNKCFTAASLQDARMYIQGGVGAGNAEADYTIASRTVTTTTTEWRALLDHGCADCGGDLSTDLPVCDGDGSNVRHAACDDARDLLDEDPAVAEAEQQATVARYLATFLAMANAHPDTPRHLGYNFTAEQSGRNYRIVVDMGGQKSVHAFIDRTTGDVYKPEGWKKPAKGVRYNLVTEYDLVAERFGWAGGYLYNEVASKR